MPQTLDFFIPKACHSTVSLLRHDQTFFISSFLCALHRFLLLLVESYIGFKTLWHVA